MCDYVQPVISALRMCRCQSAKRAQRSCRRCCSSSGAACRSPCLHTCYAAVHILHIVLVNCTDRACTGWCSCIHSSLLLALIAGPSGPAEVLPNTAQHRASATPAVHGTALAPPTLNYYDDGYCSWCNACCCHCSDLACKLLTISLAAYKSAHSAICTYD